MKIINLMLGSGKGGLEQAAVDYHQALAMQDGIEVISIIKPDAAVREALEALDGTVETVSPKGVWDVLAARRIRKIAQEHDATLAICHGNRAIGLAQKKLKGMIPVVGVAHNYNIKKRFPHCDAIFCITRDLIEEMVHLEIDRDRLFHIPNMIRVTDTGKREKFHTPPIIGSMGRFVEKKGFDIYIQALKALKDYQVDFKAVIGGDGPVKDRLVNLAQEYDLEKELEFIGWVEDKDAFFESIDFFVLPSVHEPFGIVLIEAMAAGLPCITTDTEGPCEIIKHHHDAVMVEKARPYMMASELKELIEDPDSAFKMGYFAHLKARDRYDIHVVSEQLKRAVEMVVNGETDPT